MHSWPSPSAISWLTLHSKLQCYDVNMQHDKNHHADHATLGLNNLQQDTSIPAHQLWTLVAFRMKWVLYNHLQCYDIKTSAQMHHGRLPSTAHHTWTAHLPQEQQLSCSPATDLSSFQNEVDHSTTHRCLKTSYDDHCENWLGSQTHLQPQGCLSVKGIIIIINNYVNVRSKADK